MAEALEGLTPISLRQAVEALPRRALQSLAKKQGVKANQKSDVLARQLFDRFLAEAAAQAGGASEDGEVPAAVAAASAGPNSTAEGGLSPVSEGVRYCDGGEEEREGTAAAQHNMPAPSPVPEGLAFNPLFAQQEAAAGEAGHPAGNEQPAGEQGGGAALSAATRRVKLLKRERGGAAGTAPAGQQRVVGGKRKASVEAPEEAAPRAPKRQARKSGGAGPGATVAAPAAAKPAAPGRAAKPKPAAAAKPAPKPAAAAKPAPKPASAAAKPAAADKPSVPAALKVANGPRPAPPAKPNSAAASQGQVPPAKPVSAAPSSSKSMAERARLAEERHAARRAAALARAGKA